MIISLCTWKNIRISLILHFPKLWIKSNLKLASIIARKIGYILLRKLLLPHPWKILINNHDQAIHHEDWLVLILSTHNFIKYIKIFYRLLFPSSCKTATPKSPINICICFWSKSRVTLWRKIDMEQVRNL